MEAYRTRKVVWPAVVVLAAAAWTVHDRAFAEGAAPGGSVTMEGTAFTPAQVTVTAGTTVTWVNKDPFPHTVFSDTGKIPSAAVAPDGRFQFTPTKPGRYDYICTLHPGMKGTLIVKPKTTRKRSSE